jgi:hypothetical protein
LNPGEVCKQENGKNFYYQTNMNITCNSAKDKGYSEFQNFKHTLSADNCTLTLVIDSPQGCVTLNYYVIESFFEKYKEWLGAVIIAIGVFLCTLGGKIVKPTLVIVVTLSMMTIVSIIVFNVVTLDSTGVWITLGCSCLVGLIISFFILKVISAFFMIIGGYMGYTVGIFLYHLALRYINSNPTTVYWVTIVACVIFGALLGLYLAKHVLIIGSCVMGGYFIIKGASLYIGGFPDEGMIMDLIKKEEWEQLEKVIVFF